MSRFIEYDMRQGDDDGKIVVIRLNRPERMNAMSTPMTIELAEAFIRFAKSDAFVAIITGTGRAFTAGMDIKENIELGHRTMEEQAIGDLVNPFFQPGFTRTLAKPVISAVNGYAFGYGFFLSMEADICVAAESASFEVSEVVRGIPTGWYAGYWSNLPRHINMELAFGGRMTAQRAYDVGMVNKIVPDEELMLAAFEWARHLCRLAPSVIRIQRELVDALRPTIPGDLMELGDRYRDQFRETPESVEGLHGFFKK